MPKVRAMGQPTKEDAENVRSLYLGTTGAGRGEQHRSHGLLGRPAIGAGDARDRGGPGGAGSAPGALGHGPCDGLAHRAVLPDQLGRDAEGALLQLVRIDDERALGPPRAAGHFGQKLGGEAARAALGATERLASRGDLLTYGLGEGDTVS